MNNFRATVIPDNPYRKMIIGRIAAALVVAILSTISAFMVLSASSGVARAGRDFCPDGHTCYWAEQRQTERRACHVQHADLGQGGTWTEERCGLVVPTATATPFQPEPTRTSRPLPSPTRRPAGEADPRPTSTLETTRSPRQYPAATNTPTPLPLLFSSSEVCDICQMLPPLQTMAAAQATMAARP